jgi:cytolysin (calcineurin-like family phosphatase)
VKIFNRRRLVKSALVPALASFSAFTSRLGAQSTDVTRQTSDDFNFILLGDTPYFSLDEFATTKVMQESSPNAAFSIHVGDIKSSFEPCSDELLARRFKLLDTSPIPLIYLPGDNEWVDCKKSNDR